MYVSKKKYLFPNSDGLRSKSFAVLSLLCDSDYTELGCHINVYCCRFPCGRIKLIVPGFGMFFTGKNHDYCASLTFDSVRSLYSVPGVHIHTDILAVYAALGIQPYACK